MSHGACRMSTFFHSQTGQITQLLHELNIIQQRVGIPLKLNCNKPSNKFDIIKLHSTIYLFHLSGSARQAAWLLKKKKMQFRDEEDSITEKPYLHPVNSPMPFALSWRIGCHHKETSNPCNFVNFSHCCNEEKTFEIGELGYLAMRVIKTQQQPRPEASKGRKRLRSTLHYLLVIPTLYYRFDIIGHTFRLDDLLSFMGHEASKFKNSSTSGFTISENSLNTSSKLEIIMKGFELVNAGISHPEC
ncbi:hypothetical protein Fcan01_21610 [Folsomia candida]|uniref:Uncharacterized protein n=1 Tax=Folsomia candida TaxID=158441 RepID=A0A226DDU1_FOLCA|nr:hypothetical protein Fcan01_21610 [Folsomia candida]